MKNIGKKKVLRDEDLQEFEMVTKTEPLDVKYDFCHVILTWGGVGARPRWIKEALARGEVYPKSTRSPSLVTVVISRREPFMVLVLARKRSLKVRTREAGET